MASVNGYLVAGPRIRRHRGGPTGDRVQHPCGSSDHLHKNPVPGCMAEDVIDVLEAVEVEQQQRARRLSR